MKISTLLLIVVLIATAVTFLSDVVFPWMPSDLFSTILIAIAGGLIAALLIAMAKSLVNLKALHVILAALIGPLVVFLTLSFKAGLTCNDTYAASIDCRNGDVTYTDHIEICPNGKITWSISGEFEGTKIEIFDFKKKTIFGYKKAQPLDKPDYSEIVPTPIEGKGIGKKGHFKYTIQCTPPGQSPIPKDPMIDIPKK